MGLSRCQCFPQSQIKIIQPNAYFIGFLHRNFGCVTGERIPCNGASRRTRQRGAHGHTIHKGICRCQRVQELQFNRSNGTRISGGSRAPVVIARSRHLRIDLCTTRVVGLAVIQRCIRGSRRRDLKKWLPLGASLICRISRIVELYANVANVGEDIDHNDICQRDVARVKEHRAPLHRIARVSRTDIRQSQEGGIIGTFYVLGSAHTGQ